MSDIWFTLTQIATLHRGGFSEFEIVRGVTRPTVALLLTYRMRPWFF